MIHDTALTSPDPTISTTDARLVQRLKAGDADAYEEVVRTLGGRMLAVARRFLQDEEAARDAVQDAFLSAFRSIDRFDGHSQFSTWLHRIVVNASLMRIRTRQRRPEQSIEPMLPRFQEDGHHAEPVVSWAESAERHLERKEAQVLVRDAIAVLPEAYRTVLLLRDLEELSTREAAAIVGITENALKLRLLRARQALSTVLRQKMTTAQGSRRQVAASVASVRQPAR